MLTPREHLDIFYDFKGGDPDPTKKETEIDQLLTDVDLKHKSASLGHELSGGQKRKLSAAMSFIGGSKLIIMDEPTSSLDLSARRLLWTMLKKYKKDRIVLLTTHYMDEADILGDRIGVMAEGRISALGTSLFLKKTFSLGFKLDIVKNDSKENEEVLKFCRLNLGPNCR